MSDREFFDIPVYESFLVRLKHRKKDHKALFCEYTLIEIPRLNPQQVEELADAGNIAGIVKVGAQFFRRARKLDGTNFRLDDLRHRGSIDPDEDLKTIKHEPDHPLAPTLPTDLRNYPHCMILPVSSERITSVVAWASQMICLGEEILVPTLSPSLSLGLDRSGSRLWVETARADQPSLELRMPTISLSPRIDRATLGKIRKAVDVKVLVGTIDPGSQDLPSIDSSWIQRTLASLAAYVELKGSTRWPPFLAYAEIQRARVATWRAETVPISDFWLGTLLEAEAAEFGNLEIYIRGVQDLLRARYLAVGEAVPDGPEADLRDLLF